MVKGKRRRFGRWWLRKIIWVILALLFLLGLAGAARSAWESGRWQAALPPAVMFSPAVALTHEQDVWLHALEWCESRGIKTAINPKDLDGTPSYYSFQFKPSTFKQYGIRYGLLSRRVSDEEITAKLDDYNLQKQIVTLMINDPRVNWRREFPACVRQLGSPPSSE